MLLGYTNTQVALGRESLFGLASLEMIDFSKIKVWAWQQFFISPPFFFFSHLFFLCWQQPFWGDWNHKATAISISMPSIMFKFWNHTWEWQMSIHPSIFQTHVLLHSGLRDDRCQRIKLYIFIQGISMSGFMIIHTQPQEDGAADLTSLQGMVWKKKFCMWDGCLQSCITPDTLGFPRFVMLWLEVGRANRAKASVTDGVKLRLSIAF